MIYGYSERGIFNSIIFYLDEDDNIHLMEEFLELLLGIKGFTNKNYQFTFLNEQSFSEFGDSDLTIIIENKNDKKDKTVLFIEGKVKTFNGKYSLQKECDKLEQAIKTGKKFDGFSSNIFVQLYFKYLLSSRQTATNAIFKKIDKKGKLVDRKIGNNKIVNKAYKKIKDAKQYFYIAILPENITSKKIEDYFDKLKIGIRNISDIRSVDWKTIDDFFCKKKAGPVIKNFEYNRSQIY